MCDGVGCANLRAFGDLSSAIRLYDIVRDVTIASRRATLPRRRFFTLSFARKFGRRSSFYPDVTFPISSEAGILSINRYRTAGTSITRLDRRTDALVPPDAIADSDDPANTRIFRVVISDSLRCMPLLHTRSVFHFRSRSCVFLSFAPTWRSATTRFFLGENARR